MHLKSLVTITILFTFLGTSLSQKSWEFVDLTSELRSLPEAIDDIPEEYTALRFDIAAIKNTLHNAPMEFSEAARKSPTSLQLPLPNGKEASFELYESPVMSSVLGEKFPDIKTYAGKAINSEYGKIRMSVSSLGITAVIHSKNGPVYIHRAHTTKSDKHILFHSKDLILGGLNCGVDKSMIPMDIDPDVVIENQLRGAGDPVNLHIYKLAVTCTGEFANFWASPATVEATMDGIVSMVNLMNSVFETESAMRYELVDNNDELVFLNSNTDPFNNASGSEMLGIATGVINSIIGSFSYDSGVVMGNRCQDVGGVAFLGQLCRQNKGAVITCNRPNNFIGYVSTTLHELGHHLNSGHTWNSCPPSQGNRAGNQAYEPGSGSTIMSYSGLCGGDNLGADDMYYHLSSLLRIEGITRGSGSACAQRIPTDNHKPDVNIPIEDGFVIPIRTPFELTGEATDMDGDTMMYSWEQYDLGPIVNLGQQEGNSPLFRSFPPNEDKTRIFPSLDNVLFATSDPTELLPQVSRNMTFRFTARDYNHEAGSFNWDEVAFTATEEAGPFSVTFPHLPEKFSGQENIEVRWNVANTDDPFGVDCQEVDIFLSLDGGFTFPILLSERTTNDGSEVVQLPETMTSLARVKIKASDNIFFDISNFNFTIESSIPGYSIALADPFRLACAPEDLIWNISTSSFLGFDNPIDFTLTGDLPPGAEASFSTNPVIPGESVQLIISMEDVTNEASYDIQLFASALDGNDFVRDLGFEVVQNDFSDLELISPANGASDLGLVQDFAWNESEDALSYNFELATSPSFEPGSIVILEEGLTADELNTSVLLDENTVYYWRILPINECGPGAPTKVSAFSTLLLECNKYSNTNPVNISASSSNVVVNMPLIVTSGGTIGDVNVDRVKGLHGYISNLHVFLESPAGTRVKLWGNNCVNLSNFNLGFDDEAPTDIPCPLTSMSIHKPVEELSAFIGEDGFGTWNLRVEDRVAGDGGQVQEISIKICGAAQALNPILENNITLELDKGGSSEIGDDLLLATDTDNSADELIYTLVEDVLNGTVLLDGTPIQPGDQFSQADISAGKLSYEHDGSDTTDDTFTFTVIDNTGGWIGVTNFNIEINLSTSTIDPELAAAIQIFPNPASSFVQIDLMDEKNEDVLIQVLSTSGQLIESMQFEKTNAISRKIYTNRMSNGVYFLRVLKGNKLFTEKIIVHKI
jgi:subtilisin-like proprotein convertase family protein